MAAKTKRRIFSTVFAMSLLILMMQAPVQAADIGLVGLCNDFNVLIDEIRDSKISKSRARAQLVALSGLIRDVYLDTVGQKHRTAKRVFPLKGYDAKSIGGIGDSGYRAAGYDFFDGNRHGGHPSLDIFIRDREQRGLDDLTGMPVEVLSLTDGVVVALERRWEPSSKLRGGNYVWIYDPEHNALIYYAHNRDVLVELGDLVRSGEPVAHVGRTGKNAWKRRSPTHLHLTWLSLATGIPAPKNIYRQLAELPAE